MGGRDQVTGHSVMCIREVLWNEAYGTCRGTGVLSLTDNGWRIAQYNLSIPIPNDLTRDFAARIKESEKMPLC